jgi:membrane protein DedA with SNARE-associated domain
MPSPESQERAPPAKEASISITWLIVWILIVAAIVVAGRLTPFKPVQDFFGSFNWMTEHALKVAKHLFKSYGYLTVFLTPLLENTIFLGAIIPGTIILLLAGVSAHDGLISLWPAIPLAVAGAWIGDTISYGMGRFGSQRLGPESRIVVWSERMRGPLLEQSVWLVLLYHFAGYSRLVGPAASGFIRMPFGRWVVLDYAGSTLWVLAYMIGGYLLGVFGLSLDATDRNVNVIEVLLFVLAVLTVTVLLARANRRQREVRAGPA